MLVVAFISLSLFPLRFFFVFFFKQDKKDLYEPVCNIPIITSPKEEERLIESSMKVTAFPQLSTEKLNAC